MSFRQAGGSNSSANGKSRGWKDNKNHYERHYCEVCNVWMASDRASILTHENGKKHAEKFQEAQAKRSLELAAQEKQKRSLQMSLQQMESSAAASMQQDYGLFGASGNNFQGTSHISSLLSSSVTPHVVPSISAIPPLPLPLPTGNVPSPASNSVKQEKKEWNDRKKQRDVEKKKKKRNDDDESGDDEATNKRKKIKISEHEGYYSSSDGSQTWLEGVVFGGMLEEDLPIQVWVGNPEASRSELQLSDNQRHWKDGLIAAVRQRPSSEAYSDRMVVDVAYLPTDDSTDETLIKSVRLQHVRILLGGHDKDDRIPRTLEAARLLAMGGEEIVVKPPKVGTGDDEIEEATGLSGWSTVKIKRTTIHNDLKEEREAARKKRKDALLKAEKDAKETEARQMEEAKVSNAHDSALGAYDVWNRTQDGYKGVNIHAGPGANGTSTEFGKKLATDGTVAFKKSAQRGVSAKKKRSLRTTSADDD
jgi:WW domain-binding protein 4